MKGLIIVIVVVLLIAAWLISTYNGLVSLRNKVRDQWAQIDVLLKRRSDLIPNIVETVKGYAKHEEGTLEAVVAARNKLVAAPSKEAEIEANGELTGALNRLFALTEAYPELKANQNFMDLQNNLKETEDKISYARQFYNDSVTMYNTKLKTIPSNIIAGMLHLQDQPLFTVESDEAAKNVKVDFNN